MYPVLSPELVFKFLLVIVDTSCKLTNRHKGTLEIYIKYNICSNFDVFAYIMLFILGVVIIAIVHHMIPQLTIYAKSKTLSKLKLQII